MCLILGQNALAPVLPWCDAATKLLRTGLSTVLVDKQKLLSRCARCAAQIRCSRQAVLMRLKGKRMDFVLKTSYMS